MDIPVVVVVVVAALVVVLTLINQNIFARLNCVYYIVFCKCMIKVV